MDKKAVVVGINYPGSAAPLNGCINDANNVKKLLLEKGYSVNSLTDNHPNSLNLPTRKNILSELMSLILSGAPNLFFHYSGHGSYVRDENGDEQDGRDETLVPCDYQTGGMILDDEIRGILECVLPHQTLVMVLDCCHSGTGADLGWNVYENWKSGQLVLKKDTNYRDTRGKVVCISGCQDTQTSADAYINNTYQGALTANLLPLLRGGVSWADVLKTVRRNMKGKYTQIPNLTCGKDLDLSEKVRL